MRLTVLGVPGVQVSDQYLEGLSQEDFLAEFFSAAR